MLQLFFLCLLFIYYWYFYFSFAIPSKPIAKPSTGSAPYPSPPFQFKFTSKQSNHFQFVINGQIVWEHTLGPPSNDIFTFYQEKIIPTDPCYKVADKKLVPAEGKFLYEYLKANPENKKNLKFKDDSELTLQEGTVFYFKCLNGRIDNLDMCPSGTSLIKNVCRPINLCTDKPDGTLFPYQALKSHYILCLGGTLHIKKCPSENIFNHDRCENVKDLNHYCKNFKIPFILDDETMVKCENEKVVFVTCPRGMKYLDNDVCTPANCVGIPDDTKLALPEQKRYPFNFIPGYMICRNDRIAEIVQCPQNWDESLSKGDNLLSLPMVFDLNSKECSVPSFCENVFSDDPEVIVPAHDFTKHVKNWHLSKIFDHNNGFVCENNIRKRKTLEDGTLVSKRFKAENACGTPNIGEYIPIYNKLNSYYNCKYKEVRNCPPNAIFNGRICFERPDRQIFQHNGRPIFHFSDLNMDSWIKPWDYAKDPLVTCQGPEFTYLELYNICSHPDCSKFAFLSQFPSMTILLPGEQAKCKFYENERHLRKEPVNFKYHFWNQKIIQDDSVEKLKPCTVGQNLETGNFIGDKSIFVTCNMNQPFVFCPSANSTGIFPVPNSEFYACKTSPTNLIHFKRLNKWTSFTTNYVKRILPGPNWNPQHHFLRKNKSSPEESNLPLDIPIGEKFNLFTIGEVFLELRYRVTHPPNVAIEYDDQNNEKIHVSTPDRGFLIKLRNFTNKHLTFPIYRPVLFVDRFETFEYV